MSAKPAIFELAEFFDFLFKEKGWPRLCLDVLGTETPCLALVQTSSPVVEKEYVNGSKIYRLEAELLYQDVLERQLEARERLAEFGMFLTETQDLRFSETRQTLRVATTAPSIRTITDGEVFIMGLSLTLIYKE